MLSSVPQFVRDCRLTVVWLLCYWRFTVHLSDFHKVHAKTAEPKTKPWAAPKISGALLFIDRFCPTCPQRSRAASKFN